MIERLHWLGHASFRWDGSKAVYFDPWKLPKGSKKADIICISHEHFDHLSKPDISAVSSSDTVILTCAAGRKELLSAGIKCKEVRAMAPGDSTDVSGVKIRAVASYNTNKEFHTRSSKKLGFVVTMDGAAVYHAGDTDRIPEMDALKCDTALLPVSGTYVMNADEAVEAALVIKPGVAVPMHYGDIVGSVSDAKRFEELLKDEIKVKILRKEE